MSEQIFNYGDHIKTKSTILHEHANVEFTVIGWYKEIPLEEQIDDLKKSFPDPEDTYILNEWIEDITTKNTTHVKLKACMEEGATYISGYGPHGVIFPANQIRKTGVTQWTKELIEFEIEEYKERLLRKDVGINVITFKR